MAAEESSRNDVLQIDAGQEGNTYVVRLDGELDLSTCEAADAAIREAEASRARWITLDIDGLSLIDSIGLRTLLVAKRRDDANGHRLRLTRGTGPVADLLRLTALDLTLPFVDPA
jgi:anti-anti-sigma factor